MCVLSIFSLVETISLKFWLRPLSCHVQERRLLKLSMDKLYDGGKDLSYFNFPCDKQKLAAAAW